MNRKIAGAAAALALLAAGPAACGDDDDDAAAEVTHEEWFVAICDRIGSFDPGFDAFFADHPEPTLDDWAGFLPSAVDAMEELADIIDTTPHAPEDSEGIDAAVAAVLEVRDDYQASLDAASAGDQAAFDEAQSHNFDVSTPAMEASFQAVDERDCAAQG